MLGDQLRVRRSNDWDAVIAAPCPRVAEPERRQDGDLLPVGSGVVHSDPGQYVVSSRLRVVGCDLRVPVAVKAARIEELVLGLRAAAAPILLDPPGIRERVLWVQVAPAHPGVGGSGVEVKPVLLGVLAVVALVPGQAEDPFLDDRIAAVPQGEGEAKNLMVIAPTCEAVLVPAIHA